MPSSRDDGVARARAVRFARGQLVVALCDGRTLSVPLRWFPRLSRARPVQRRHWVLLGRGAGIHWPLLDEDLSVAGLLRGTPAPGAAASRRARPITRRPRRRR